MIRIRRVSTDAVRAGGGHAGAALGSGRTGRGIGRDHSRLRRPVPGTRPAAARGSEIEHALMVQYLYAAYSLKPAYAACEAPRPRPRPPARRRDPGDATPGEGQPDARRTRQRAPNLVRQGLPLRVRHLPIPAEPRAADADRLAKYVYTEAPADALDRDNPDNADPATQAFLDRLDAALGGVRAQPPRQPLRARSSHARNEVIAAATARVCPICPAGPRCSTRSRARAKTGALRVLPRRVPRHAQRRSAAIRTSGRRRAHARLPVVDLALNPSAFEGHPNQITDAADGGASRGSSDLHYWLVLGLLDLGYRDGRRRRRPVSAVSGT